MPLGRRRQQRNNPGKGAALGLLSEKLVTGIGNRRRKKKAGAQQETLQQRSLPQKKTPLEKKPLPSADAANAAQAQAGKSHMSQVQDLMKSKSEQSTNSNKRGPIASIASALR